jgi:hypothetical protein
MGQWRSGIENEVNFWNGFFTIDEWKEKSDTKSDLSMELQPEIA